MSKLYHYTKLDTAIEHILPNMVLKTNFLNAMNDPKENQLWMFGGVNIPFSTIYPSSYSEETHWQHVSFLCTEIKKTFQVMSFVREGNNTGFLNEMMWAHYSQNHRGICLEVDKELFLQVNRDIIDLHTDRIKLIDYGAHYLPVISWDSAISKEENIQNISLSLANEYLFTKSLNWEKEAEERLLLCHRSARIDLSIRSSLTGIYLGLDFPNQYFPALVNLVDVGTTTFYQPYFQLQKLAFGRRSHNDFRLVVKDSFD